MAGARHRIRHRTAVLPPPSRVEIEKPLYGTRPTIGNHQGVRNQLVPVSCRQDQYQGVAVELRIGGEAFLGFESDRVLRVLPCRKNELELATDQRGQFAGFRRAVDRLPPGENLPLFPRPAAQIAAGGCQRNEEKHPCHQPSPDPLSYSQVSPFPCDVALKLHGFSRRSP